MLTVQLPIENNSDVTGIVKAVPAAQSSPVNTTILHIVRRTLAILMAYVMCFKTSLAKFLDNTLLLSSSVDLSKSSDCYSNNKNTGPPVSAYYPHEVAAITLRLVTEHKALNCIM
ncbi:hypothetical protein J6590_091351 [Homalodisca vitripennis]|nr:hypothetical protein J6590_091351 [Homalodisca vitripennis]